MKDYKDYKDKANTRLAEIGSGYRSYSQEKGIGLSLGNDGQDAVSVAMGTCGWAESFKRDRRKIL